MSADRLATVYPPLEPAALLGRRRQPGFPFSEPGVTMTHLGRGAVWLALRALDIGPGTRLAMPAYHCGSEVEAAHLAGAEIDFYRVDASLQVDADDLARVAAGCDACYLISHFGFPIAPAPSGAVAIEDAAHALFSEDADGPVGSRGQAAIFCPRKSLGVPDGGAVLIRAGEDAARADLAGGEGRDRWPAKPMARSTLSLAAGRAALSRLAPIRRAAAGLLTRASRGDTAARAGSLTATVIGEWDLEVADMEAAARRPARLTERMLRRVEGARIAETRRSNYRVLLDQLAEYAPEPYRELPEGVTPLYFPVRARDRDSAIARLLGDGVRPLEIWPVPHPLLDRRRFAELEPARRELLALPVHQTLRPDDVEHIAAAAKRAL